jgi:hypothetical protein
MKHLVLFVVMTVTINQVFAQISLGGWRFRNDDGTEISASYMAVQNQAPVIAVDTNGLIRLRIELYNADTVSNVNLLNGVLQDSGLFSAGKWVDILSSTVSVNPFLLAGSSPNVTDGELTTTQLITEGYTYQPGKMIVSSDSLSTDTINAGFETQYEWVLKRNITLLPGNTYYFRFSPSVYTSYIPLPSLQTATVLGVNLVNFTATPQGKLVELQWVTASEQDNDHFTVQRSADALTWQPLETVAGNGTATEQHTYTAYDDNPLAGINYYRLAQYDHDGQVTFSGIKSVNLLGTPNAVVYPNPAPASAGININLSNYVGKISATLTSMDGTVIHNEVIEAGVQTATYMLNLVNKPSAGVYILHLKGQNIDKAIKVVIQ